MCMGMDLHEDGHASAALSSCVASSSDGLCAMRAVSCTYTLVINTITDMLFGVITNMSLSRGLTAAFCTPHATYTRAHVCSHACAKRVYVCAHYTIHTPRTDRQTQACTGTQTQAHIYACTCTYTAAAASPQDITI